MVDYEYRRLDSLRDSYFFYVIQEVNSDVSNAEIAITNCINKINGTNDTPEDRKAKMCMQNAEYIKRTAILSIPFTTEENFLYISKTEMYCKMKAFIKEVKVSNK